MIQRTLIALFSLAVLVLFTPQLYADSDSMSSVYSGLECKYQDARWDPKSMMEVMTYAEMKDVVYHSRLGIGNTALASQGSDPEVERYDLTVSCPLPSMMPDDQVVVAIIDGTVHDDVACRVQSCVAGIGAGSAGEGGCEDGFLKSSDHIDPTYTQSGKYITQNVDWIMVPAPQTLMSVNKGSRRVPYTMPDLGEVYSHLICTIPEQDDVSPHAPGIATQMRAEQGISYIQSYYVE